VRQVVTLTGEAVVGVSVPGGERLWEYPWPTQFKVNASSPLIAGEFVFISTDYNKGCAVLRVTADAAKPVYVKPAAKGMKTKHSTAVHRDGFVYGSDGPTFRCLSLRDGKLVDDWEGPPRIDFGSPVLAGDVLLVQSNSGGLHLIAADPTEFRPRGELTGVLTGKTWATPAVVGGRIFTRDAGNVLCIDAR
jgi:outer membrane protein assembly factor BamB